ncbi:hypothetical protein TIFTF001_038614 [Ficus carica]|uniref:Uncharacterized protein n=1 Tax=Ficus carica TaxID=3494 RepID=A0AA88E7K3_FICCA|nr:hypothetical protein TIFTF001_038614 [Ficus carica]
MKPFENCNGKKHRESQWQESRRHSAQLIGKIAKQRERCKPSLSTIFVKPDREESQSKIPRQHQRNIAGHPPRLSALSNLPTITSSSAKSVAVASVATG